MNHIESRIFITRHGETASNASGVIQGRQNVPLNQKGKKQAEEKALQFSDFAIQYICASPLDRTLDTADIISKQLDVGYQAYDDLIARYYGPWESKEIQWINQHWNCLLAEMREWTLEQVFQQPPTEEMESYKKVSERVFALFREVILKHPNQNGLFITHGGVITSLLLALQASAKEIPLIEQDGYVELVYSQGQFRLERVFGLCKHAPRDDGKRVIVF